MKDISLEKPAAVAPDADQSVGQFLKEERLRQNKTLKEVAEATCIHINTIEALEEENRGKLPAEVFVRGFISIYAQYLGLDSQDALNRYGRKITAGWVSPGTGFEKRKVRPPKAAPRPPAAGRRPLRLVALGLAAAVLLGFWGYRQGLPPAADRPPAATAEEESALPLASTAPEPETGRTEERLAESWPEAVAEEPAPEKEAAPPPVQHVKETVADLPAEPAVREEVAILPAPAAPVSARPAPEQTAPPAAGEPAVAPARELAYVLAAEFTETTWLQVRLDGGDPVEYLFQPGERHSWKADAIELFLGNAGGVDLVLNGEPQPPPGPSGKTARLRFARTP